MKKCWSANAFFRPSAKDIDYVLVEMSSKDTEPLETAKECIRDNLKRKPTSLYDVFPKHIADALNAGKKVEAESHEIVTIVFSDIVGFTTISEKFPPMKVSTMLDRLYQAFDALADKHHIFKVETIGDAYMGVTNLDGSEYDTHVKQIAEYSIDAVRAASQILIDEDDPAVGYVQIRVGFNSGPVVSNVIGSLNPRYGLFGDTVNTASRMESNSMPGRIHCSLASAKLLESQAPTIPLALRGIIKVKGKGKMKTYCVGGDDIASTAPNPYLAEQMEPVSEREEDDPTNTEHTERDFEEHSHTEHTERDAEDDLIAKDLEAKTNQSDNSHGTHKTQEISLGDSTECDKDHFIKVHCSQDSAVQQKQIQMDGSVKKLDTASDDGISLPSQLYSC
jgi:class 3 adenylate cyclase